MAEMIERAGAERMAIRQGIGRLLDRLATQFTMLGGLIFCALIAMSIVSIVGRKLFATPVQGDVELMQMGAAVGAGSCVGTEAHAVSTEAKRSARTRRFYYPAAVMTSAFSTRSRRNCRSSFLPRSR